MYHVAPHRAAHGITVLPPPPGPPPPSIGAPVCSVRSVNFGSSVTLGVFHGARTAGACTASCERRGAVMAGQGRETSSGRTARHRRFTVAVDTLSTVIL